MAHQSNALLTDLLKEVSRSFYPTLRALPASIRPQISLAYLLARTTDTIADTKLLPVEQRLEALQMLRERILGSRDTKLQFGQLALHQSSPGERILLEQCETTLTLLQTLTASDLKLVRLVLDTISGGQELDLRRFATASESDIVALRTDEELDDYTYRVAGCVGEFWTRMCRAHVFPKARLDDTFLLANSVRFGKGLQMVNILRDLAADVRLGRCYLPEERLRALGLSPAELLQPANLPRLRPLLDAYIAQSEDHLRAGWIYTNSLPWSSVRVRLACAWPILIGYQTLKLLRAGNVLDPQQRIKISRKEIKNCLWRSVLYYPWPAAWKKLVEDKNSNPEDPRSRKQDCQPK